MEALARYLFLIGRMDLRKVEYELAVALVPVFWPGGHRIPVARIVVERLFEQGVGSNPTSTARALSGLCQREVLTSIRQNTYALEQPVLWNWPDGRHNRASLEWAAATDPMVAWKGQAALALATYDLLEALKLGPTAHPGDPQLAEWFLFVLALTREYGDTVVITALQEAVLDPAAIVPPTPHGFEAELYGLYQRARRRRSRRNGYAAVDEWGTPREPDPARSPAR